jgi:hypothetical protein
MTPLNDARDTQFEIALEALTASLRTSDAFVVGCIVMWLRADRQRHPPIRERWSNENRPVERMGFSDEFVI